MRGDFNETAAKIYAARHELIKSLGARSNCKKKQKLPSMLLPIALRKCMQPTL